MLKTFIDAFNFKKQAQKYGISVWQYPQFIFLVMGILICISIVVTYLVARYYFDPYYVIILATGMAAALLIASYIVVSTFEVVMRSSVAKSEFIGAMSHRLRTAPTKIKWQLELLLNKKDIFGKEAELSLLEIQNKNEEVIRMANDLIDLNLIEDGRFSLSPSSFSLEKIAADAAASLEDVAKEAAIPLSIEKSAIALPDVFADKIKIKTVICHLVDNAIHYNRGGGSVRLTLEIEPDKKMARCSVFDEGVGIPDNEAKDVFKKFFRSKGASQFQTGGIGIGLFITKTIVEKSGGSMGFKTMEGKGSVFWFTLPFAENQ